MKILIFAIRLSAQGFGVDVVIKQLSAVWESIGYDVHVGCILSDISSNKIHLVKENSNSINKLIENLKPNFIYIHTYPFWDFIPNIKNLFPHIPLIIHDHGDPTPELFQNENTQSFLRRQYETRMKNFSLADKIITISEFIKFDIGYPEAEIIYHGSDNIPDYGVKKTLSNGKLKIGMLGRIGQDENNYKGIRFFREIVRSLGVEKFEFYFCGHGKIEDAQDLISEGIKVKVNITEKEKIEYLRAIDIFISTSLWEGFNLPLIEAQSLGTLSLAFDTGAHPEVTIFHFSSVNQMVSFINTLDSNRGLLLHYSHSCYAFSRSQFSWKNAAIKILSLNSTSANIWKKTANMLEPKNRFRLYYFQLLLKLIRDKGLNYFVVYGLRKVLRMKN